MGTIDITWQQTVEGAQHNYETSMNNALWSMHNAKRMLQKLKRLSRGDDRAKYERMLTRFDKAHNHVFALLLDIFETEDDDDANESGEIQPCHTP